MAVRRLQFGIIRYWYTCIHRPARRNEDADSLSRLGINTTMGPSITRTYSDNIALDTYYCLVFQLSRDHPCSNGEVTPHGFPGYFHNTKLNSCKPPPTTPALLTNDTMTFTPVTFEKSSVINDSHLFNNDVVRTVYAATKCV